MRLKKMCVGLDSTGRSCVTPLIIFDQLFEWALHLIRNGDAYVDEQSAEEMRANRGTLTEPGVDSPYRDRSPKKTRHFLKNA